MGQRGDLRGMKECWRGKRETAGAAGRFAGGGGVGRFARDAGAFWLDLSAIVRYNIP